MMYRRLSYSLLLIGALFGGCDTTALPDATGGIDTLSTLSEQTPDYGDTLRSTVWRHLAIDLDAMHRNDSFPSGTHTYPMRIRFGRTGVTAYANCYKLTATYRIDDTRLYFDAPQQLPTDQASCTEYELADEAVYTLFQHDYTFQKSGRTAVVLKATDLPAIVTLQRD